MASTTTTRRPRIDPDVAALIDDLRENTPFESYINDVLRTHAERLAGVDSDPDLPAPLLVLEDERQVRTYLQPTDGGFDNDNFAGVTASLSVDDETFGHVGAYLKDRDLRALRDAITDMLGEVQR